jgi:hypothetical protein
MEMYFADGVLWNRPAKKKAIYGWNGKLNDNKNG